MSIITLHDVSKKYPRYSSGFDRLKEVVSGKRSHEEFVALHPLSLDIQEGEVVGLIGMNGAGKSTLLKIVSGTLLPSSGTVAVRGRVSALLELGAGFHPELSGRDNVRLSCAAAGMSPEQIDEIYQSIVDFSGVADFVEQPVKTYSSGMFVRLAFAVATSVDPDILIIDEALSVGDGAFARRSFDRIMGFKKSGKTILFCSHSLYQVEAICSRVIWMHQGRVMLDGDPASVISAYDAFLIATTSSDQASGTEAMFHSQQQQPTSHTHGYARIERIEVAVDGKPGKELEAWCGESTLSISIRFSSDPSLPTPSLAVAIVAPDGRFICSAGSHNDGLVLQRNAHGEGLATLTYPAMPLLKGHYMVNVYLMCENAIHIYEQACGVAELKFKQRDLQQGLVSLPHYWKIETS